MEQDVQIFLVESTHNCHGKYHIRIFTLGNLLEMDNQLIYEIQIKFHCIS